jgi:hypothetical protein
MSSTPQFTLTFQQMFLLVNRLDGATVLMPAAGHTATLAGSMFPTPVTLTGADVFLRRNQDDYIGTPTLRPGSRYLPYLDYVFHGRIRPRSTIRSLTPPPNVHARVILSGGYLTELPASDEQVANLLWNFTKANGDVTLTQALTDRVVFTLPLQAGVSYTLVVRTAEDEQEWPIPQEGADLLLLNTDGAKPSRKRGDDGLHTLKEYALLYNLTSASDLQTLYPYPVAYTAKLGSDDEPICGGGQTDEGDPPPP